VNQTTTNQAVDLAWRAAAAVLACFSGNLVIDAVVYAIVGDLYDSGLTLAELWLPMLASTALMVAVLVFPARRSLLSGRRLYAAMFLTVLGINVVLMHVEGIVFLEMSTDQIVSGVLRSVARAAWVVFVIVWLFGRTPTGEAPEPRSLPTSRLTARWALAAVCYTLLYVVAGMLIYPYVQAWYEAQGFTGSLWIFPLQLVRGALYVAFSLWLLRSLAAPRWQVVLATACLFPVLAGVGALLIPNPIMPDQVRFWHLGEIAWSNFVFGAIVALLFAARAGGTRATPAE